MTHCSLWVNGEVVELPEPITAAALLEILGIQRKGVAMALNEAILPRSEWDEHVVRQGDRIEIVTAAAGG